MNVLKRWLLSTLLLGFLTLTIMAMVGAQQNRVEVEKAKIAILGTLVCKKDGDDSWAGSVKLKQPYGFAHGIILIQPRGHTEPWKEVTVKARLTFDGAEKPFEFVRKDDFWSKGNRNEFFLHHPPGDAPYLSVNISGIQSVWRESELRLDVVNMLCGCENTVGDFLVVIAWATGLISVVLIFFTIRAFRRQRPAGIAGAS